MVNGEIFVNLSSFLALMRAALSQRPTTLCRLWRRVATSSQPMSSLLTLRPQRKQFLDFPVNHPILQLLINTQFWMMRCTCLNVMMSQDQQAWIFNQADDFGAKQALQCCIDCHALQSRGRMKMSSHRLHPMKMSSHRLHPELTIMNVLKELTLHLVTEKAMKIVGHWKPFHQENHQRDLHQEVGRRRGRLIVGLVAHTRQPEGKAFCVRCNTICINW